MNTLLESGARPYGSRKSTIVSMLLHGGLIVAAIIGTSHSVLPPREAVEEHTVLYVAPPPQVHVTPPPPLPEIERPRRPEPPKKAAPEPRRPRVQAPTPAPRPAAATPRPAPAAAPAMPSVAIPANIPISIPASSPVPATAIGTPSPPAADPAPQRAASSEPTSGAASGGRTNEVSSGDVDRAFTEFQVERAVEVTRSVVPRYPESLRSVNVEGEVVLRFIVDANGRVEAGSIEVVSSPNKLFTDSARRALLDSRFRAAEAGGNKVRQLAQQVFTFKLQ